LIADDHAVVRAGVRQILSEKFSAEFVEAQDAHAALEAARRERFDVVILDLSLPGRSGLDILPELKTEQPDTPVLVLSMFAEEQFARRALRAGASGYLMKTSIPQELGRAVEVVQRGEHYVSPTLAQHLAADVQRDVSLGLGALSAREFEVLRMIANGQSGKEIAAELSLSFKTISTYRKRITEKLDLHSNAEITRYALEHDLIE
jgi:DNA-binding NarL/FixJ family response regulator